MTNQDRFSAIVKKELGAWDVQIHAAHEPTPDAENIVWVRLEDGRIAAAIFETPPQDRDAIERRLSMLASSFLQTLEEHERPSSIPRSLEDELRVLARRAMAADAFVIDAQSPVVWGSASGYEQASTEAPPAEMSSAVLSEILTDGRSENDEAFDEEEKSNDDNVLEVIVAALRDLPDLGSVRHGKAFSHRVQPPPVGYLAHSFSGIYLLVVAFREAFDELRAERAVMESLARIERLVLALPPRDPDPAPMAGVMRLPRRRR